MRRLRAIYPRGIYRESDWLPAEREIGMREDEGDTWDAMYAGVERYVRQCEVRGSIGTQYVTSPAKFFRERHYLEQFRLPQTKAEVAQDSNVQAAKDWLAQSAEGT